MRSTASFGSLAATLVLLSLAGTVPAQEELSPRGCATMLQAQRQRDRNLSAQGEGQAVAASVQAASLSARTLTTTHFAIHYTLGPNVHRIRLDSTQDATLKETADSIRASLPPLTAYKRDSTLHAQLDTLGAAHPVYVQRAATYFERAWEHYDSLGMDMPSYSSVSGVYLAPSQGRYVVDIADVNVASGYPGAYYGLAYEPPNRGTGSILLENDFLYAASYNAGTDQVTGTPVRAFYPVGQVYRNYNVDWDLGLKVTASHEFYHSVQYSYTDALDNIHAWYELSATGMEERLAPEVNDYFQYLPYNVPNSHQASLFTPPPANANYGNAIFHLFLTHALGAGFDRPIWEALGVSNNLSTALVQGIGSQALWDSLYAAYAAAMVLSGTPGAAGSPLAFSPDMPEWPKPRFDTVPAAGAAQLNMPALTFRLVRPPATGSGIASLVNIPGGWRVDSAGAGYQSSYLSGGVLPVNNGTGSSRATLAIANASFSQTRQTLLSKTGTGLSAGVNPIARSQTSLFFLAQEGGSTDSLRIVSESGRRVATLPADGSGAFWNWNLKDPQNRTVPPGLYFFGIPGQTPKPLVVLP